MLKPLRPDENKRDWFLFHMTPLGMVSEEAKKQDNNMETIPKSLILCGAILIILLMLWAFN